VQTISQSELQEKQKSYDDVTIINTLPDEDFEKTKIPGSINVPQHNEDFVERVSAAVMNNKQAEIVVYCASKQCDSSTQAARKLESAGFENIFDYEGGFKDWQQAQKST
jgi:rhodanese-related sulfurtransferase